MGRAAERNSAAPELDDDLEKLLMKARQLVVRQHRDCANAKVLGAGPGSEADDHESKGRSRGSDTRQGEQYLPLLLRAQGGCSQNGAPYKAGSSCESKRWKRHRESTHINTEAHHNKAARGDDPPTPLKDEGARWENNIELERGQSSNDDLERGQRGASGAGTVAATQPDKEQWTTQDGEQSVQRKSHMRHSMGVSNGSIANFGMQEEVMNTTQQGPPGQHGRILFLYVP
ncbi:hypothetical protein NDU88_003536 [Pleurodeles waltl]|uniref:Uncharacterized protein n=1 Tax=Pleurodeles waltl TaxID=8319 RepID=A0AAV7KX90_PLEWA|nr:hypothetical protein NDU88_003536 [Pleurodeles waltl]